MPTNEEFLRRQIELKETEVIDLQEEIGDLRRELRVIQGKVVNNQSGLGGSIEPKPIFDPFMEG
jgi:hypothetical protein